MTQEKVELTPVETDDVVHEICADGLEPFISVSVSRGAAAQLDRLRRIQLERTPEKDKENLEKIVCRICPSGCDCGSICLDYEEGIKDIIHLFTEEK